MNRTVRTWLIAVATVVLAALPLTAQGETVTAPSEPDAVRTHGGWVCQDWPWHICFP